MRLNNRGVRVGDISETKPDIPGEIADVAEDGVVSAMVNTPLNTTNRAEEEVPKIVGD